MEAKGQYAGKMQFGASGIQFRDAVRSGKYDGVIIKNTIDEGTIYIALKSNQVKLADHITKDSDGNDIPIEKRFDSTSNDMRY